MAFLLERIAGPDSLDLSASSSQSTILNRDQGLKRSMNGMAPTTIQPLDSDQIYANDFIFYWFSFILKALVATNLQKSFISLNVPWHRFWQSFRADLEIFAYEILKPFSIVPEFTDFISRRKMLNMDSSKKRFYTPLLYISLSKSNCQLIVVFFLLDCWW